MVAPLGALLMLAPLWGRRGSLPLGGARVPSASAAVHGVSSLRPGALATGELRMVGLQLKVPEHGLEVVQDSSFFVKASLWLGGREATADETARFAPADSPLEGTLSGPGLATRTVTGTLGTGLQMPGLPQEGDFVLSGVKLMVAGRPIEADPQTVGIHCLGQVLIGQVTSTPMTLSEIKDAGIQLGAGNYEGRRFTMALTIGSNAVNLSVPVAIPIYNGLEDPRQGEAQFGRLELENLGAGGKLPDLAVIGANIVPDADPFTLSRPAVSHLLRHNFKALLVIPGSIGYLHQFYKVNVVVFNTLKPDSPYVVSHVTATYNPPPAADGVGPLKLVSHYEAGSGTVDDSPVKPVKTADAEGRPGQGSDQLRGGDSGSAVFYLEGLKEGSHPLDFVIQGQFGGGDLAEPIPLRGLAQGKVLIRNPTFNLMLVHPDVVRKGEEYTLEARLTNTSGTLANAVSISIDRARLSNLKLVSDPVQSVDTLAPGETASFKFQMRALATGEARSSYLYIEDGTIGFQLSAGIGERNIRLNPDTLLLPKNLDALPEALREAMLRVLGQAYSIATSKGALPLGVLPIPRGVVTDKMASDLSEQGFALRMGADRARVWWDLWRLFTQNPDPGFDQLMRTTEAGEQLRQAFLKAWPWADAQHGLADRLREIASFGYGTQGRILVGIQGAQPGLALSVVDPNGQVAGTADPLPLLPFSGSALGQADDLRLFQVKMDPAGVYRLVLANHGSGPQSLKVVAVAPVEGQAAPVATSYDLPLGWTMTGRLDLGVERGAPIKLYAASGEAMSQVAPQSAEDAPAEPFQVLAVHRYDQEISPDVAPYGTQVMALFNRTVMPLDIKEGDEGFQQVQALMAAEANQPWRKTMGYQLDENGGPVLDDQGNPVRQPSPPALAKAYPRVVSLYLEKPVGPYIPRTLTFFDGWKDEYGSPLQGERVWPIRSGYLPGGAVVKGRLRKLDGTGVPGRLTYWYGQAVNDGTQLDLAGNMTFAEEGVLDYYAQVTNNVATEADGSFQLDFVPETYSDYQGPFVLQGDMEGGRAFAQASVLGNGQLIQMDLVLEGKGSIEGFVVDAQGYGMPGVKVQAVQEQQTIALNRGTGGGTFHVEVVTDAQGHYRIEGLKTGVFSMRALKDLFGVATSGEIQRDGEVVRKDLVLKGRLGSIRAQLLGLNGQPVRDQALRLGFPAGLIRNGSGIQTYVYPEEAKPDGDGWVRFADVPAGDFRVMAPYLYSTQVTNYQGFLEPGTEAVVTLRMVPPEEKAKVRVHVIDSLGRPVANALAKYTSPITPNYNGQTDQDGFTPWITHPSGRQVHAVAYHPAWVGETGGEAATLEPGGEYTLMVRMPPRSSVSGMVRRSDGTPVKGAYVAIPPVYDDNKLNRLAITDAAGHYVLPTVPTGQSFRLATVGPELRTYANLQVQVSPETAQTVDVTLPLVGNFTIDGTAYQPMEGSQKIPAMAQVWVESQLPSIGPSQEGNDKWGLPFFEEVANALTLPDGKFSLRGLPSGPYGLHASSDFFPVPTSLPGSFDDFSQPVQHKEIFLTASFAGELKGKVFLRDGQTLAPRGVRVTLKGGSIGEATVLTQDDGTYKFAKVIPAGWYRLRAEDPVTGDIVSVSLQMKKEESQIRNLRLWGRGTLKVHLLDSAGQPLREGVVSLAHSKDQWAPFGGPLLEDGDLPPLTQKLLPEDQGVLTFEDLLEGAISLRLKDPNGLQGSASTEIPVGGADVEAAIRLQPLGNIRGLLKRPDGSLVPAGRVDAYGTLGGRSDQWLGVSPTSMEGEAGRFIFEGLPTGIIQLEAFDPDTRQVGRASVTVSENQTTDMVLTTQDLGPVAIQVVKEGQPVFRAGLQVRYTGGPALSFTTEATTDPGGMASFMLPPGDYRVEATDPVTLSTGTMTFSRAGNQDAISKVLTLRAVRSVFATVLPPPGAPELSRADWRLRVDGLNRTILLDAAGQGMLQDLPVGVYQLTLTDGAGRLRGAFPLTVLEDGGAVQPLQIQALAHGTVSVRLLDQNDQPVPFVSLYLGGSLWEGNYPITDLDGKASFTHVRQGSGTVRGSGTLVAPFTVDTEGQVVEVLLRTIPTARIHGQVVDPSGSPAAFVSVKLSSFGMGFHEAATDGAGRYAMSDLPLGSPFSLLAVTGTGRTGTAGPVTLTAPNQDLQVDITLSPQGRLAGTFTDALRPQLPPLTLEVFSGDGRVANGSTGENGAFEFVALPAGVPLTFQATWDDGRTVAFKEVFTIPGEGDAVRMDRALPAFVNLKGWTLDLQRNKIPMTVILKDDRGIQVDRAVTTGDIFDPDHPTFFFHYLKAGSAYQLFGIREGATAPTAFLAFTPSGQAVMEQVDLVESAPRTLRLQLRYPDGSPAPGRAAQAQVTGRGPLGGAWTLAFAADGSATVQDIHAGPADVRVSGLPWQSDYTRSIEVADQDGVQNADLPVQGVGSLALRVQTPSGKTATQGQVSVYVFNRWIAGQLGTDGSYAWAELPIGLGLFARASGFSLNATQDRTLSALSTHGEQHQETFPIAGWGAIAGRLLDRNGQPVPGGKVSLFAGYATTSSLEAVTAADGAYQFGQLPLNQTYKLMHLDGTGDFAAKRLGLANDQETVPAELRLHGLGTARVHLRKASGAPLPGVALRVSATDAPDLQGATDGNGDLRLDKVPAGMDWTAAFTLPVSGVQNKALRVEMDQTQDFTWNDRGATRVVGPLHRATARPFPAGTQLFAQNYLLNVAPDGQFDALNVPLSEGAQTLSFSLSIQGQTVGAWTQPLVLDGDTFPNAAPAFGQVQTSVLGPDGNPLASQSVQTSWRGVQTTAADGTLPAAFLPAGPVQASLLGTTYKGQASGQITEDGGIASLVLHAENARAALVMRLRYPDGQPAPGAGATAIVTGKTPAGGQWTGAFQADGSLRLDNVLKGAVGIQISGLPWQGPLNLDATVLDAQPETQVAVQIHAVGSLQVQVKTDAGRAVSLGKVALSALGKRVDGQLVNGFYRWAEAPVGEALSVEASGFILDGRTARTLQPLSAQGEARDETMIIPGFGSVQGHLYGPDGAAMAGAQVQVFLAGSSSPAATLATAADGSFQLDGIGLNQAFRVLHPDADGDTARQQATLVQDQQSLAVDLRQQGLGALNAVLKTTTGKPLQGFQVTLSRPDTPALKAVSDAQGIAAFPKAAAGDWTAAVSLTEKGYMTLPATLQRGQTATITFTDQAKVDLSGTVHRTDPAQTWPSGATLEASMRADFSASVSASLNANGSFSGFRLDQMNGDATVYLRIRVGDLTLPLAAQSIPENGRIVLALTAPSFGSVQAHVTSQGQPASWVQLVFGTRSGTTDSSGMGPVWLTIVGDIAQIQATKEGEAAFAQANLDHDGQTLTVDLALAGNRVALPASIILDRLGFTYYTTRYASTLYLAPLYWSVEGVEQVSQPPAYGSWKVPGQSLAFDEVRGDVTLTQILANAGYGLRQEFIFANTGTLPRRISLRMQTGVLKAGQDLRLGTANQAGGGQFDSATLAWGKGPYVPNTLSGSGSSQSIVWPELVLQPGEVKGFWVGQAPYDGNSYWGYFPTYAPNTNYYLQAAGAPAALARMIGAAPEWVAGLDPRTTLTGPSTVLDALPPWNDTRTLVLMDPTGLPVERLTCNFSSSFTPADPLAPASTWGWGPQVSPRTFIHLPPGGGAYRVGTFQGTADQPITPIPLTGWTVAQFHVLNGEVDGQPGAHSLMVSGSWSPSETLSGTTSSRYTCPAGSISARLTHAQNPNLVLDLTVAGVANQYQSADFTFPPLASLDLASAADIGRVWLVNGAQKSAAAWSNGHYLFPAVVAGAQQASAMSYYSVTGWDLGAMDLAVGPNQRTLGLGTLKVQILDGTGQLMNLSPQVAVAQGDRTDSTTYANPALISLPPGTFRVTVTDPRTTAAFTRDVVIGAGQTQTLTFTWGAVGSVVVTAADSLGQTVPAWYRVRLAGADGGIQTVYTDGNGQARFSTVAAGSATAMLLDIPGAVSSDIPTVQGSALVTAGGSTAIALTFPRLVTIKLQAQTQAGDSLPYGWYTVNNRFQPGTRDVYSGGSLNAGFEAGAPLQVIYHRYYDGGGVLNAAPLTVPVQDAQTVTAILPLGRLTLRVLGGGQPLANVWVQATSGNYSEYCYTAADGTAVFKAVPVNSTVNYTLNRNGTSQGGSLIFTGPIQSQDVAYSSKLTVTAAIIRGSSAYLPTGAPWTFSASPAGAPNSVSGATATWNAMPSDVAESITFGCDASGSAGWNWVTFRWGATQTVTPTTNGQWFNLKLPARASVTLAFQDQQGNPLDWLNGDSIHATLAQAPVEALQGLDLGAFDFGTFNLGDAFLEGSYVLDLRSELWGPLGTAQFTVAPSQDGATITVPVRLPFVKSHVSLKVLAGDGETPVPWAGILMSGTHGQGELGSLYAADPSVDALAEGASLETDVWSPAGATAIFTGVYDTAWGEHITRDQPVPLGPQVETAISLPLTVVRAKLTEPDGTAIEGVVAENMLPSGGLNTWPLARINGSIYALALGATAGDTLPFTLYESASGMGSRTSALILPVGQRQEVANALSDFAWIDAIAFQSAPKARIGVVSDAASLVKPENARWFYGPPYQGRSWYAEAGASGTVQITSQGAITSDYPNTFPPLSASRVRVPRTGTLWIALPPPADGSSSFGAWARGSYEVASGASVDTALPSLDLAWVTVPFQVVNGNGEPLRRQAVRLKPENAPMGWYFEDVFFGFGTTSGSSELPIGMPAILETAPWDCYYDGWSGRWTLTPTSAPEAPGPLFEATEFRPRTCLGSP